MPKAVSNSPSPRWYAVRVRGGWEKSAGRALESKGIEVLVPMYGVRRRWCDRWKWIEQPLFPGYFFCRCSHSDRVAILVTPGVMQLVGHNRTPIPVDDGEINSIRDVLRSELPISPWPFCRVGDPVYLTGGPLRGLQGILLEVGGEKHLLVSVSLLQRSVVVKIDETWAVPEGVGPIPRGPAAGLRRPPVEPLRSVCTACRA